MNRSIFKILMGHKLFVIGFGIVISLVIMAVFAPKLAPHDPSEQDLYHVLEGPSRTHWLGTDDVGRDLLSRVIYGARVSLYIGIISTLVATVIGLVIGLVAGYKGGLIDMVLMRLTDTFMCMPALVLLMVIVVVLGPGMGHIIIAIAVITWPQFARIIRGQVLAVKQLPYVESAHAIGASGIRIMTRYLLPNTIAPAIVTASITLGGNIMLESAVTFLGIGVQPPTPTWGKALRVGYSYLEVVPLFSIAPGLLITLAVLGFNFIGDGLRDGFDPYLKGEAKQI